MSALAKIHIAKKELALTDEAYRDILRLNFRVGSAKDLSESQARSLIDFFKAKGWVPKPAGNRPVKDKTRFITVKPGPAAKQQRKVLALWHELGYDMAKLHGRVKRQFKVDRFEWLEDSLSLHILISDLQRRLNKRHAAQSCMNQ
jgi:phage gp16-like protein